MDPKKVLGSLKIYFNRSSTAAIASSLVNQFEKYLTPSTNTTQPSNEH